MRLALGTAQFGSSYGVSNKMGKLAGAEARAVLDCARSFGIRTLDTAIAYGVSEASLGELGVSDFEIVTKLPSLPALGCDVEQWVDSQVKRSLERLGITKLHAVLLHCPEDLIGDRGSALNSALDRLVREGLAAKIGISIYEPDQAARIWAKFRPDIVQFPFNILDRRMQTSGWIGKFSEAGVEIHSRSAFLQGLLLMKPDDMPLQFSQWRHLFDRVSDWAKINHLSLVEAALGCAKHQEGIDKVVIGVDCIQQLEEIIGAWHRSVVSTPLELATSDQLLIDPTNWTRN
jgi:aryl-alcohol dehydrogenase-like predicted oxidoreductase